MRNEPDSEPVYNVKFLKLYPHVLSNSNTVKKKKKSNSLYYY